MSDGRPNLRSVTVAASTPIMERLTWAVTQIPFEPGSRVVGEDGRIKLHDEPARKVVYAVLAELVQAADELEADRLQPMTTQETLLQPTLGQLIDAFGRNDVPAEVVRSGLIRVLERMLGEPQAVQMTIFGKSGWRETALQALLEAARQQNELHEKLTAYGAPQSTRRVAVERAEDARRNPLDAVSDALRALTVVQRPEEHERAADVAARAISQLAKEHADDAYRAHLSVGHVAAAQS